MRMLSDFPALLIRLTPILVGVQEFAPAPPATPTNPGFDLIVAVLGGLVTQSAVAAALAALKGR